ncbi:MAG: inositol monophosphatase family protein [Gammaproteobacteria bacterium]|nr:inositol monophosphatase family protein [Gammaproteobacteria bacterium]
MEFDIAVLTQLIIDTAKLELIPRYQETERAFKADGTLVTAADLAIQKRIETALSRLYPDIPFLGEEMPPEQQQRVLQDSTTGFWCLDPLDGTANFVAGMPCFGISLAYLVRDETRLGIIYDPMRNECFHAQTGQGAWLNDQKLRLDARFSELSDCVAMVDLKRLPINLGCNLATRPPYRSQRSIGSVALDWCWLAAGRLQLYLHGGQRLWDFAAGQLIFAEAGGSLRLSDQIQQTTPYTHDLQPKVAMAAVSQGLFKVWADWIEQHR